MYTVSEVSQTITVAIHLAHTICTIIALLLYRGYLAAHVYLWVVFLPSCASISCWTKKNRCTLRQCGVCVRDTCAKWNSSLHKLGQGNTKIACNLLWVCRLPSQRNVWNVSIKAIVAVAITLITWTLPTNIIVSLLNNRHFECVFQMQLI